MTVDRSKLLVVANPDDSQEICAMLAASGYPEAAVGDGSDATLSRYLELSPSVVVVCANLDHGDAQSLVASMRGAVRGDQVKIILIGEVRGPIRNALDAGDFGVDRFLGRPLSAKALAFSVRTCLVATTTDDGGQRQGPALVGAAVALADSTDRLGRTRKAPSGSASSAPAEPGVVAAAPTELAPPRPDPVGSGRTPALADRVERAVDLAIEDFVSDAIGALGDLVTLDPPMLQGLIARSSVVGAGVDRSEGDRSDADLERDPVARAIAVETGAAGDEDDADSVVSSDHPPRDLPDAAEDSRVGAPAVARSAAVASPSTDDLWVEPPPPLREPTLILSGGGAIPPPVVEDRTEKRATFAEASAGSGQAWADAEIEEAAESWSTRGWTDQARDPQTPRSSPVFDEVDDLVDDLSADLETDLVDELEPEPVSDADRPTDRVPAPPDSVVTATDAASAGAFARELRRKMSQMAERLFGDSSATGSAIEVGLAHDHQTEIDLTSIGDELPAPLGGPAAYEDFGAAETFADVGSSRTPLSEAGTGSTGTGVSESGIIEPPSVPPSTGAGGGGLESDDTTARRPMGFESQERGVIDIVQNDVATLVARLFASGFTGELVLRRPPAEKSIHFERGRPVFARSNLPHDRMGDLLFREGKITRSQHSRSRELVAESGRRMGEILIDMGFLKGRELLPAVRRHIEDIIYSLFAWDSGEFTMTGGDALGEKIRLSRHPAALLLEGIRRKYPLEWLEKKLGSAAAVVATGDKKQLHQMLAAADLARGERAAIDSLDGERSLAEVAEQSGIGLLAVYQLAFGLTILGVAEVIHRGDQEDGDVEGVRPPSLVGETDLAIDRQRVMAKHALVTEADYFTLLGVRRNASAFEIKRAYESARRDYAGDSFPAEVRDELDAEITEINEIIEEAYQVLRSDQLRASYRDQLRD